MEKQQITNLINSLKKLRNQAEEERDHTENKSLEMLNAGKEIAYNKAIKELENLLK